MLWQSSNVLSWTFISRRDEVFTYWSWDLWWLFLWNQFKLWWYRLGRWIFISNKIDQNNSRHFSCLICCVLTVKKGFCWIRLEWVGRVTTLRFGRLVWYWNDLHEALLWWRLNYNKWDDMILLTYTGSKLSYHNVILLTNSKLELSARSMAISRQEVKRYKYF